MEDRRGRAQDATPDEKAASADGQEGSGRQHPTGTGAAYRAPKERSSAGGKPGGKRDKHQGS